MGFITDILASDIEKERNQLDVRRKFRLEQTSFLENDNNFARATFEIRKEYGIKNIDPDKDIIVGDIEICINNKYESMEVTKSNFLIDKFKSDNNEWEKFHYKVLKLLQFFNLETCFYDYVQYWILYNKKPDWEVSYSLGSLILLLEHEEMISGYPLTSKEKQFLCEKKREKLGLENQKGRISNPEYKSFLDLLKKSKNTIRSSKLYKMEEIIGKRKGFDVYVDEEAKEIKEKITYKKLALEIEDSDKPSKLARANSRLRKINQRIKERVKKIKNKR